MYNQQRSWPKYDYKDNKVRASVIELELEFVEWTGWNEGIEKVIMYVMVGCCRLESKHRRKQARMHNLSEDFSVYTNEFMQKQL